jgi:hypothetical protein
MEVEYEITPDDLYAFQWRAVFQSPLGRRTRRTIYLGWVLAVVLFAAVPAIGADGFVVSRMSFTFILVALPIIFVAQWGLDRWVARRTILRLLKEEKPGKGQLGRHRIVLGEDGLKESTAVGESRTSWAGVDRIEQNQDYIFIYTSHAAAHVIPKRAFSSPRDADAFYGFARARQTATAPGPNAKPPPAG